MLQEQERSQKSEETYFTLLILSIVLNEGHSRPRAHLCVVSLVLLGGQQAVVTVRELGHRIVYSFMFIVWERYMLL